MDRFLKEYKSFNKNMVIGEKPDVHDAMVYDMAYMDGSEAICKLFCKFLNNEGLKDSINWIVPNEQDPTTYPNIMNCENRTVSVLCVEDYTEDIDTISIGRYLPLEKCWKLGSISTTNVKGWKYLNE